MHFSIKESLVFGWHKTRAHSGLLFKVLLIIFALQVASAVVTRVLEGTLIGGLASVALSIAQFVVGVGLTYITLRLAQGKHTELKDIIPPLEVLWRYFASSLLVGLIALGIVLVLALGVLALGALSGGLQTSIFPMWVGFGVLVGVIALVYISLRFSMVRYAILDGAEIGESLTKSIEITKGHLWHLLGFLLVLGLLNLLGMILLLVGLLVTIPVSTIAYASVYEKLRKHKHS